jgi:hypothetical protein
MFKDLRNCLKFGQSLCFVSVLISSLSSARGLNRAPANIVPDDDMIIVPLNIEGSMYEDFNEKHKEKFKASRQKLEIWMQNEQYAKDYGLEGTGSVSLPTQEDKEAFIQRNYLRFISKDVQKSTNRELKDTWSSLTTNDEIDSISEREDREEYFVKAKKRTGKKQPELETRIKVGTKKFKLRFQPRVEQGMMKITLDSEYVDMKALLGVNGNQEVEFKRRFRSTGTKALLYYYIDESRVLASVDQNIKGHLSLRFAHEKDLDGFGQFFNTGNSEINSLQVRFNMGF